MYPCAYATQTQKLGWWIRAGDKENLAWAANGAHPQSAAASQQQEAAVRVAEPWTDSGISGSEKWSGVRHTCIYKRPRIYQTLFLVLSLLVACPRNQSLNLSLDLTLPLTLTLTLNPRA